MTPLANDPLMSGRLILSFRHLAFQNQSIISDSIGRARMMQQFWRRRRRRRRSTVGLEDGFVTQ